MGIRANTNTKDHLGQNTTTLLPSIVDSVVTQPLEKVSLRFFTAHKTKPREVDLNIFRTGQEICLSNGHWAGPFSGRPELIAQLKPAIMDRAMLLAYESVEQIFISLRAWWRLFDLIEEKKRDTLEPLNSVSQLTEVHRQVAVDTGMGRLEFSNFLQLANTTRKAIGLKPLYWSPIRSKTAARHLPSQQQTDIIRQQLKRHWFAALARWSLADDLLKDSLQLVKIGSTPEQQREQERLLRNYKLFDLALEKNGILNPSLQSLLQFISKSEFYKQGYSVSDMLRGSYPDSIDIRVAFH